MKDRNFNTSHSWNSYLEFCDQGSEIDIQFKAPGERIASKIMNRV